MIRNAPVISVGMPVFNGEEYLGRAIESLLIQSFLNFEVIISDNASTDRTEEICRSYRARDGRVRYFRNSSNIGILPNWRRVLDLASGDYFMWAACDDYWDPNYIETLLRCLLDKPNAVLAAGSTMFIAPDDSSRADMVTDRAPAPGTRAHIDTAKQLLSQHATNWLHGIYRKEALLRLSETFFREHYWGSDVLFLLQLCLAHEVVGTDDAVMYKCVFGHKGPATPRKRVRWQCWFAQALLRVIVKSPISPVQKLEILESYLRYLKWLYFRRGVYPWLKLWGRAGYHWVQGADRP
jgi:glycosyltransferase involved in cell wall biosynthesis